MRSSLLLRQSFAATFVLTVFVLSTPVLAVDFRADIVQHVSGESKPGQIYVKEMKYRMEQREGGEQIIQIVNQQSGVTLILSPARKKYIESPPNDPETLMNDPFQSARFMVSPRFGAVSKRLGRETISGYLCDKYVISQEGTDLITQWISQKLSFPIKVVRHPGQDTFVELTNIKEGPLSETLFQIPSGYTKTTMAEGAKAPSEGPAWAAGIASARVVTVPNQMEMTAGQIIRAKVPRSKGVEILARNTIDGESIFTAVKFRGGKLDLGSMTTFPNKEKGSSSGMTFNRDLEEGDEVIIRVVRGQLSVSLKEVPLER
jgi:hypothetical protein